MTEQPPLLQRPLQRREDEGEEGHRVASALPKLEDGSRPMLMHYYVYYYHYDDYYYYYYHHHYYHYYCYYY